MTTRMRHAIALAALLSSAGCGNEPDLAACEAAMREQYAEVQSGEREEGSRPSECDGVSDQELTDIAERLIGESFGETP